MVKRTNRPSRDAQVDPHIELLPMPDASDQLLLKSIEVGRTGAPPIVTAAQDLSVIVARASKSRP